MFIHGSSLWELINTFSVEERDSMQLVKIQKVVDTGYIKKIKVEWVYATCQ